MGDIKYQQQGERRALLASGMRIFPPLGFTIEGNMFVLFSKQAKHIFQPVAAS